MDLKERINWEERRAHWTEPAVTGGPMGGVPRWLYVLILGGITAVAFSIYYGYGY